MHCVTLVLLSRLIVVSILCIFLLLLCSLLYSHTTLCVCMQFYVSDLCLFDFLHAECMVADNQKRALAMHMHAYTKCHVSRWNAINAIAFRAIFTDYPNRNEWICIAAHAQHMHTHTQLMCAMAGKVHSRFCILPFAHTHTHSYTHWDMTFSRIYFASIFNNTECDCSAMLPKHECDRNIGSAPALCRLHPTLCFLLFVCLSVNSAISLKRMCRANFTCLLLLLLLLNAIYSIKYLFYVKELTLICEWNFICIPRMYTLHTIVQVFFAGFRPCMPTCM